MDVLSQRTADQFRLMLEDTDGGRKGRGSQRGNPLMGPRVVFTINNFTDENLDALSVDAAYSDCPDECPWSYLIWTPEHCDGEGTPHIQGYGELRKRSRRNAVQILVGGTPGGGAGYACLDSALGTAEHNLTYISKEHGEPWFTWGKPGPYRIGQGARSDLEWVRNLALEGGMRAVTARASSLQQMHAAALFLKYHEKPRRLARGQNISVTWLWGETGSGKSHIGSLIAGDDAYRKTEGSKWFEGYDGQKVILLNDFRPDWLGGRIEVLLNLLDKYEFLAECKHGSRQIVADTFVITSDRPPWSCYTGQGDIQQLVRRCTRVVECQPPSVRPAKFRDIDSHELALAYVDFASRCVEDVYPDDIPEDTIPVEPRTGLPESSGSDISRPVLFAKVSKGNIAIGSGHVPTLSDDDLTDLLSGLDGVN